MRRVAAVISTLFRCGLFGGLYGAVLGVVYAELLAASDPFLHRDVQCLPCLLVVALTYGLCIGFLTGFISGLLSGSLGGPIGCSIGGFFGTGATMLPLGGAPDPHLHLLFTLYPSLWGATFGLVFGVHLYRRVPVLPGARWLAESIYDSPLRGWLGWRQRHVEQ